MFDDGHGDYNRSYERDYDDFDYADYSTDHRDNNYRNFEKKRRKSEKEIIKDILNRWDWYFYRYHKRKSGVNLWLTKL